MARAPERRSRGHSRLSLRLLRGLFRVYAAFRGWRDARRLRRRIPEVCDARRLAAARKALEPIYRRYIGTVSSDDMAISIELAAFLTTICEQFTPQRILDLGSGLSSVTFRRYAAMVAKKPTVVSVDDSREWLDRTREFLASLGLPTEQLWTWDEFVRQDRPPFDLILHDLGTIALRGDVLEDVLSFRDPAGVVVLDDAHKVSYHRHARRLLRRKRLEYAILRSYTLDRHGRFALLVLPSNGHAPLPRPAQDKQAR